MSRKLDKNSLKDIVKGAAFLGTGGGGSIESGMDLAENLLDNVKIVSVEEVNDNDDIVVVAGMGAPEELLKQGFENEAVNAFEAIEEVTDTSFDYVIPVEIGAFNSLTPMTVTMDKNIPTIDADGAGRAIPELQQTMYSLENIPISPAALADDKNSWAVFNSDDPFKMEDMTRAVTHTMNDNAGLALHIMKGSEMKQAVIKDTLTLSEKVGKVIRKAKESGRDPVAEVKNEVNGFELICGNVTNLSTETKEGFDFGRIEIQGTGDYEGNSMVVDYKNENMLAKKDGKIVGMVPDRICWITTDGKPLTNADVEEGLEVACIGIKAPDRWRTEEGFNSFKRVLEALDYEGDYIPIEDLQ